jgi:hypothetical protein
MEAPEAKRRRRASMRERLARLESSLKAERDAADRVAHSAEVLAKVCYPDWDQVPSARDNFHRTNSRRDEEVRELPTRQNFARVDSDEVRLAECHLLGKSLQSGYYNDGSDGSYRIKKRFY